MLPAFMSRAFTRKRYPKIMDHGSEVVDWQGTPETATFYGVVQPGTGTDDPINRDGAEVVKTIWAQPGADVQHDDVVTLPDGDYQVNGSPERWETGILDHVVIRLSHWRG